MAAVDENFVVIGKLTLHPARLGHPIIGNAISLSAGKQLEFIPPKPLIVATQVEISPVVAEESQMDIVHHLFKEAIWVMDAENFRNRRSRTITPHYGIGLRVPIAYLPEILSWDLGFSPHNHKFKQVETEEKAREHPDTAGHGVRIAIQVHLFAARTITTPYSTPARPKGLQRSSSPYQRAEAPGRPPMIIFFA